MMRIHILSFLVCVVSAYLLLEINARPKGGLREPKPAASLNLASMDSNVIQEMKSFKLEILKKKILSEIRMSEPPEVQTPIRVPREMLKLLGKTFDEEASEEEEEEEFIIYPSNENFECAVSNETVCSRFEFQLTMENRTIPSLHIWFYKSKENEPLFVAVGSCFLDEIDDKICETQEVISETKAELNWSIFKVPSKLSMFSQLGDRIFVVEVYGQNIETRDNRKPFLVADVSSTTSERKRRSTRTTSTKICTQECCKIDFYISFKEIGWHFVVAPAGFHANMCYGKCINDQLNAFPSHYHRTMNLALANKTTTVEKKEHTWTPCCSPTNLKPLNMIYKAANDTSANSTHTLVHHEIPDMIAESCGCW